MEHLSRFENAALLHRYTNGIKCRVFVTTFAGAAQQWFNQLPVGAIESFQEFHSLFLHQFASSQKVRKTELSLFVVRQKEDEPIKEYLQRFNTTALDVPAAMQEVKASAFSQGLLDGDFFKSLAKKPSPSSTPSWPEQRNTLTWRKLKQPRKIGEERSARRSGRMLLPRSPVLTSETENPFPEGKHCVPSYDVPHHADSGSSADILFGEAYDQMQLGDVSLEKGSGRSTRNPLQFRECYVEAVRKGQKRNVDDAPDQVTSGKKGKTPEEKNSEEAETPAKVQPAEELLNIEIIPRNPNKTTRISSHLGEEAKKEITLCLQRNADIFAWTPQDLEELTLKLLPITST
ncbi:UNVERIFIED_CONTAM: hypothetical protein Slati_3086500 [Sesamum latifolium]|uniref:Retrotransposon gag domain-containing protein n=1 Tax=Sesamum latifolium TaxID=2727402 RepID=A0AAW2UU41_9LAMI